MVFCVPRELKATRPRSPQSPYSALMLASLRPVVWASACAEGRRGPSWLPVAWTSYERSRGAWRWHASTPGCLALRELCSRALSLHS